MALELKVFQSFNCSLCESPYSKSPNDPKYPRQLFCGKVVCKECWKEERVLHLHEEKEERKHQCDKQYECDMVLGLESNLRCDLLLDLLNDPSINESPNGNGYLLSKPITSRLKCPKCDVKYSMEKDDNKPIALVRCGHSICTRCYLTHRIDSESNPAKYQMNCSVCDQPRSYHNSESIETRDNWLRAFLEELPQMTAQIFLVSMKKNSFQDKFNCKACSREYDISDMFFCETCNEKICGICAFRTHRYHEVTQMSLHEEFSKLTVPSKRLVGKGSYGEVFELVGHNPPTVIKYIHSVNQAQLFRFQQEFHILKKLKHKNIVTLLVGGFIEESRKFGIVMEFCEQGTLKEIILNPNLMYTMSTVIWWGEELFDALNYMFEKHKVVHRDIKPENIFVTMKFRLKIGDFGFVKYIEQSCSGSFVGTERYMSPPQLDGNKETIQNSHRNDVYSMGLVLWEIIERRIVLSEYNNETGKFIRDHFISDLSREKITKLTPPDCHQQLQDIVTRSVGFDRLSRPTADMVCEELKQMGQNSFYILLSRWPIEDQAQESVLRPFGFDGTINRVPVESSSNHSLDL